MKTKICTKCKRELPITLEYFYSDKRRKGGLRSQCQQCEQKAMQEYRQKYLQTEKGRENSRKYRQKYWQTQSGKASIKKAQQKYYKSRKGKGYHKKYCSTVNGHLRQVYKYIKRRCDNPDCKSYKNYGGRGIQNRFISVEEFLNYVINELQVDPRGLQIDRINNGGNYEKGNIRFVTAGENLKNRRVNK